MRKLFTFLLIFGGMVQGVVGQNFDGGTGTFNDPYQVATAAHLNNVRNYLSAYFILISIFLVFCQQGYTQPPPPADHGRTDDQPAQSPIGGGLLILAGLGLAYGAGKVYVGRKKS